MNHLLPNKAIIKVDFENAFNSIRRDERLCAVQKFIPNLLPYVHSAYSTDSVLLWGSDVISSSKHFRIHYEWEVECTSIYWCGY